MQEEIRQCVSFHFLAAQLQEHRVGSREFNDTEEAGQCMSFLAALVGIFQSIILSLLRRDGNLHLNQDALRATSGKRRFLMAFFSSFHSKLNLERLKRERALSSRAMNDFNVTHLDFTVTRVPLPLLRFAASKHTVTPPAKNCNYDT